MAVIFSLVQPILRYTQFLENTNIENMWWLLQSNEKRRINVKAVEDVENNDDMELEIFMILKQMILGM